MKLKLSGNRKVSPLSRITSSKEAKVKVKNAFGLPAFDSCTYFTEWCIGTCYADRIQTAWTNVDALVWHNLETLRSVGSNVPKMVALLDEMVKSVNWHGQEKVFRWLWNGDVFSALFARAIAKTCDLNPEVQFWMYTRSFAYTPHLWGIPNLVVYLSVDEYNIDWAKKVYNSVTPGTVWIAACADTWEQTEEIMREVVGRNAPRCPELTGKIPLVSDDGVGACVQCKLCYKSINHVRFSSQKAIK